MGNGMAFGGRLFIRIAGVVGLVCLVGTITTFMLVISGDGEPVAIGLVGLGTLLIGLGFAVAAAAAASRECREVEKVCDELQARIDRRTRHLFEEMEQRRTVEQDLRLAASVFDSAFEGILVTDARNKIISTNAAFCTITGYDSAEVLGKDPRLFGPQPPDPELYEELMSALGNVGQWQGEMWNKRKDGVEYLLALSVTALQNEEAEHQALLVVFSDITDRARREEELEKQAKYDSLTELPNRSLLLDEVGKAIAAAPSGGQAAVMFIDLDRFKRINETHGHKVGNEVLKQAAQRLGTDVHEGGLAARLGADEFGVLLAGPLSVEEAEARARDLLAELAKPYRVNGSDAFVSASIGLALFPADGDTPESLLRNADTAMFHAKLSGRNRMRRFTAKMRNRVAETSQLADDLHGAVERGEFTLYYQPILDVATEKVVGAEALIRWQHPSRGLISPLDFIPVAEETGVIVPIGQWVLETACQQLKTWQGAGMPELHVGVNISPRQVQEESFRFMVEGVLDDSGVDAKALMLEITESIFLDHAHCSAVDDFLALRQRGARISLDDFGTGYSSLSYLKRLPVDVLKIDRSFIRDCHNNEEDLTLVHAILAMARALEIDVVGEGAEESSHLQLLRDGGCDYVQGFLFSRPLPLDEFEAFVRASS